ncbi:TBC1 domain family member 15 [Armigeres subalbatus]|uniref:TBC1 domain family member 15 n=1 Tax=Armigeres subalbatus TaxID=124917 RepID=UPI002ED03BF7
MDNENEFEEIFIQHGVTLKKASASYISALNTIGVLLFGKYKKGNVHYFEWKMSETCEIMDTDSQDSDWSLVHTTDSSSKSTDENAISDSDSQKSSKVTIRVLFRDIKDIEFGKTELRFYNNDSTVHSLYLFNHGSPHAFVDFLERKRFVRRSSRRKNIYHCLEETDNDKLQKSFSELNIEDITSRPRPTYSYMDFMSKLASMPHQILPISKQPDTTARTRTTPPRSAGGEPICNGSATMEEGTTVEHGKETECRKLAPRPDVHRGEPLDAKKWAEFRATNGSITDADRVKDIIFYGGISNDIRADVWKYLLGLDIWDHTSAQREERRGSKTEEYFLMKLQWQTISPIQEHNFNGYRERKCQIEKDVKRTDRTYAFFAGDDNPNLNKLQEILMTYVMYNFDLGYVQGMSDLLAPILCLVQNQADSFWCFVGFMQKVFNNFDIDQKGMKQQLEHLRTLLAFVNEKLYKYLKDNQSENMYFCFRWLLVWFKREFSNSDIMLLWEVLWTGLPCPNFHLFVCVAILDQEMDVFIDGKFTFTEILKHVNELSGNLNVIAVLEQAESIYLQVKKTLEMSKEPHTELRKIIGEEISPSGTASIGSDEDDDSCMSIVNDKSSEDQETAMRKTDEACEMSMSYAFF